MNRILKLVRTTLAGGILFLLPVIVAVVIVGKALAIARKLVTPLAAHLPVGSVIGLHTPELLAIMLLILFCFLAGFLARTVIAQKAITWLETAVLSNVPGYEFIKGISGDLLAVENQPAHPIVLARIGDAWQMALLVERVEGGHHAVFVPDVPHPQSGSLYYLTEDRIRIVELPPKSVLKCLKRYGLGSNALLGGRLSVSSQAGATPAVTEEFQKKPPTEP
ncbi:MAG TPA: DUF502 domain-containing protein [Candidatus Sulfopaludibacter sp.]|nr:DUF502 domain-containing protein [Candidatus Sulfopaludibacter sp.]